MRHVSRTHRVALDWLFDRINLDPNIQIKNIDTKNQLADMLTEGNFARDEWKHLLRLFQHHEFIDVFLQPFLIQLKIRTPFGRERWKKGRRRALWWQNRGQWVWYHEDWARINLPCWIRVQHTARGTAEEVAILISQALRNQGETETKTQRQVLKCGTEMTILFQVPRDRSEVNQRSSTEKSGREVQNQLTEVKLKSQVLDTWRKSSRMFDKSWIIQKTTR